MKLWKILCLLAVAYVWYQVISAHIRQPWIKTPLARVAIEIERAAQ